MNINFFPNCETVGEVKSLYRELAKLHHPDLGGDLEMMKQLNLAYHAKLQSLNGQERTAENGKTYTYKYNAETEQRVMDKVAEILKAGVGKNWEVEVVGIWVWVSNTARADKDLLNKNGCGLKWHSKRSRWYWKPYSSKARYSSQSFDSLRSMYGSRLFENEKASTMATA